MNQNPIYLDAMCTSPHFPKQEGELPTTSKVILPDLKRTGIRSKYSKPWRAPALDKAGKVTDDYREESMQLIKSIPNPNKEKLKSESSFNIVHRKGLSDRLTNLDKSRTESLSIARERLLVDTRAYGFKDIHSDTIILTPEEMAHQSVLLNNTMQARSERTRKVYNRMTLFQSMLNDDKD
mmetsp:Transcript_28286/g.27123  ORF Transcript_28286/g.27123 Transcript_28286/m.27123 type:complete len:180 (+) Transcript_28286:177-716(+)|eukprot:CAMPEP_0119042506 /NCGR_PEP_ID=MMETSP1177-20130426/15604_1 /TAXON_ID=2985 /ORGANISM="Ochromonas sp, Strain CCMP1899" /LENGTH=179 /DNA_ID=CAMNT_0007009365 /DNA_START=173 /DNA_END=712 /DNA_ORIENTATION=+